MNDIEEMYRLYASPVKNYVLGLCRNNAMADDITADTFYKALCNIEKFQGGRMLTWLCAIARNTYIDYTRKKEYQTHSLSEEIEDKLPASDASPEDAALQKDERISLYRKIQMLDQEMKDVVYLRIFAELSFREIGSILGKSENWARVTFYRSKNKLKGWMEDEDGVTM